MGIWEMLHSEELIHQKLGRPGDKIYFNGYQIKFENCEINYLNIQDIVASNVIG